MKLFWNNFSNVWSDRSDDYHDFFDFFWSKNGNLKISKFEVGVIFESKISDFFFQLFSDFFPIFFRFFIHFSIDFWDDIFSIFFNFFWKNIFFQTFFNRSQLQGYWSDCKKFCTRRKPRASSFDWARFWGVLRGSRKKFCLQYRILGVL